MEINKLYVYPIKSLRGVTLDTATLTEFGFTYDRHFMILQLVDKDGEETLKNSTRQVLCDPVRLNHLG